jgi:hypothetical protein
VFIEHPPENSMALFSFTSTVLDEGTMFIFGSWICVANGSGGFNSHLANSRKLEASAANECSHLDEFIDNRDELLLLDLAGEIERMFVFDTTSTRAAPGPLGSNSNRSEEARTLIPFGLRNATSVNEEATWSKSLSDLEKDLDHLLKLEEEGATACWGASIFDNYSDSDDNYSLKKIPKDEKYSLMKSTRRLVLHLQYGVRENTRTRVPPHPPPSGGPHFQQPPGIR